MLGPRHLRDACIIFFFSLSLLGWVFSRFVPMYQSCLTASSVGIVGYVPCFRQELGSIPQICGVSPQGSTPLGCSLILFFTSNFLNDASFADRFESKTTTCDTTDFFFVGGGFLECPRHHRDCVLSFERLFPNTRHKGQKRKTNIPCEKHTSVDIAAAEPRWNLSSDI